MPNLLKNAVAVPEAAIARDYLTVSCSCCLPYLVAAEEPPGAYLGTFEIVGSLA